MFFLLRYGVCLLKFLIDVSPDQFSIAGLLIPPLTTPTPTSTTSTIARVRSVGCYGETAVEEVSTPAAAANTTTTAAFSSSNLGHCRLIVVGFYLFNYSFK
jgi:hypothetical protein